MTNNRASAGADVNLEADHYAILGVSPLASQNAIKDAYRALMKDHHPDTKLWSSSSKNDFAAVLNLAYAILRDPTSRAQYDYELSKRARKKAFEELEILALRPGAKAVSSYPAKDVDYREFERRLLKFSRTKALLVLIFILSITAFVIAAYNVEFSGDGNAWHRSAGKYKKLSDFPQPPRITDLEIGSFKFLDILTHAGMNGAQAYSIECHRRVKLTPSWVGADQCASFDYAAAYVDQERSIHLGKAPNRYFTGQQDLQIRNYQSLGADEYAADSRLRYIRQTIEFKIAEAATPRPPR